MRYAPALQFARAAGIYWGEIFPLVRHERRAWERRAVAIPDPALRHDAQFTLQTKWGHSEGAAAFATLVPREYRPRVVRMVIAYESLVDYLDTTSERQVEDPYANTFRLHQAMFAATGHDACEAGDYYELHPLREDGGYLASQIDVCRRIFLSFPSHRLVANTVGRFATLYSEAQSVYHSTEAGRDDSLRAKSTSVEAERHSELQWGEMLAAGSSLVHILVLLALAAREDLSPREVELVSAAYYPWISSLHILLHGLVDQVADHASGQLNQLSHYRSPQETAERLQMLGSRSRLLVGALEQADMHEVILAGMVGYYLAPEQVWAPDNAEIAQRVLDCLNPLTKVALLVHSIRHEGRPRLPFSLRRQAPESSPPPIPR